MRTQTESCSLEFSLLRTFLAVIEHGSQGRTAAAVDKSQPAISQQMLRLEKIVGQKLFARSRDGHKLTRHGELLAVYANRAVYLHEEALVQLRGERVGRRVSLGMTPDVALAGLTAALKCFQSVHPGFELRAVATTPDRLDSLLKAGKLDLAIGDPDSIAGKPAFKWTLPLQWAAVESVNLGPSRVLPLVLFEGPCPWQDRMLHSLRSSNWEFRPAFESSSFDAIVAATQSGLGMAALPAEVMRTFGLTNITRVQLPSPPSVEFGLFRGADWPGEAQTVLEASLASLFKADASA
jgi:DNA-binding transcriptional LysR family regulator